MPGPLLVSGLALTLLVARRERDSIDLLGVKWGLVGRVPGVAIGAFALALIPEAIDVAAGRASWSLAGVALGGSRLRITPSPRVLLVAGFVSGIFGTIASIGGPPLALLYQHETRAAAARHARRLLHLRGRDVARDARSAVGRYGRSELIWTLGSCPRRCSASRARAGSPPGWTPAARAARCSASRVASGVAAVLRSLA